MSVQIDDKIDSSLQQIRGALSELSVSYSESTARKRELIAALQDLTRSIAFDTEQLLLKGARNGEANSH